MSTVPTIACDGGTLTTASGETFDVERATIEAKPGNHPPSLSEGDQIMQAQRSFRSRIVLHQHAHGEPFRVWEPRPTQSPPASKLTREQILAKQRRSRRRQLNRPNPSTTRPQAASVTQDAASLSSPLDAAGAG